MRKSELLILANMLLSCNLVSAADYTWETPTVNNWVMVSGAGEFNYNDGDIIGNNGTSTAVGTLSAIDMDHGKSATLNSPGTLNVIVRPAPHVKPAWLYGIFAYSSTGVTATPELTELTLRTKVNVDVESAVKQNPGNSELGMAIKITAQANGGSPGESAITKANFLENVNIKAINKTVDTDKIQTRSSQLDALHISAFDGGRTETIFHKDLYIEGHVETDNKHIAGITVSDQGENGIGSKIDFRGNTTVNVASEHGGRVWGMLVQATPGTETMSFAEGTNLNVTAKQRGGQNFSEGVKFNSLGNGGVGGNQIVTNHANTEITADGDYYANALSFKTSDNGRQNINFSNDTRVSATANEYAYGIKFIGANNGVNDSVFAKGFDITTNGGKDSQGISVDAQTGARLNATIKGTVTMNVNSSSSTNAIYSSSKTGAVSELKLEKGLTLMTNAGTGQSFAVYSVSQGENSQNKVIIDGDINMPMGNSAQGHWVAYSFGKGSEVSFNPAGGGVAKIEGFTYVVNEGKVLYKLDTTGSYLKGIVTAGNDGMIGIDVSGEGNFYEGKATNYVGNNFGNISMNVSDKSLWKFTDTSRVTNLTINDGLVDMSYANGYQFLITDNLNGENGTVKLDIDASTNVDHNDRIYVIKEFTGTQYLDLNEVGHGELNGAAGTVLATVNVNNGTFLAKDGEGTLYWNRYELDKKTTSDTSGAFTTDWFLKRVSPLDKPSTSTEIVPASISLAYHGWRLDLDKLLQRMGELRNQGEDAKGLWVRVKGSQIGYEGMFSNKYRSYEIGYDEVDQCDEEKIIFAGASLSYNEGKGTFGKGVGNNYSKALTFYRTEERSIGHYLDLVFKMARLENDFTVVDSKKRKIHGENSRVGFIFSGEYGRKKYLSETWYIEPQAQLTLGYLRGTEYELSNGVSVREKPVKTAIGRIGFNLGKDLGEKSILYVKANLLHEFAGDVDSVMSVIDQSVNLYNRYNNTWFEYGLGFAKAMSDHKHIYFDVERSVSGKFQKDWQWNIGARITFE